MPNRRYISDKVRAFRLSKDHQVTRALVTAIPENWRFINGSLWAPDEIIASGKAAGHSGYLITRRKSEPQLLARTNEGERKLSSCELNRLAARELVIEQKQPRFVDFHEAGFYPSDWPLSFCKELALAYLERGYRMGFSVVSSHKRDDYDSWREEYWLEPDQWYVWQTGLEDNILPPAVILEWQEKYGGTWGQLEPIATVCRSLGLEELTIPVAK